MQSGIPGLFPAVPVADDRVLHFFRGCEQPVWLESIKMAADVFSRVYRAQVDVSGLPSHGKKQLKFVAFGRKGGHFDARTMWRQAADDPVPVQTHKRIRATHRTAEDGLVENLQ